MTRTGDDLDFAEIQSAQSEIPILDATAAFAGEPGALESLAGQVRRSCIASSNEDCVFAGARLISSANSRFVNIGPGLKVNFRSFIS